MRGGCLGALLLLLPVGHVAHAAETFDLRVRVVPGQQRRVAIRQRLTLTGQADSGDERRELHLDQDLQTAYTELVIAAQGGRSTLVRRRYRAAGAEMTIEGRARALSADAVGREVSIEQTPKGLRVLGLGPARPEDPGRMLIDVALGAGPPALMPTEPVPVGHRWAATGDPVRRALELTPAAFVRGAARARFVRVDVRGGERVAVVELALSVVARLPGIDGAVQLSLSGPLQVDLERHIARRLTLAGTAQFQAQEEEQGARVRMLATAASDFTRTVELAGRATARVLGEPMFGWQLQAPVGWRPLDDQLAAPIRRQLGATGVRRTTVLSPVAGRKLAYPYIVVQQLSRTLTPGMADGIERELARGLEALGAEVGKRSGRAVKIIEASFDRVSGQELVVAETGNIRFCSVIIPGREGSARLWYYAPAVTFEQHRPAFEAMVASLVYQPDYEWVRRSYSGSRIRRSKPPAPSGLTAFELACRAALILVMAAGAVTVRIRRGRAKAEARRRERRDARASGDRTDDPAADA